jgi:hypothetical protein
VTRGGGLSLAQEEEEMGRERKKGALVLTGISGMEQRRGVWPGVVPRSEEVGDRGA